MFIDTIYSSELYHHGVKGMKWGVRKKENNGVPIKKNKSLKTVRQNAETRTKKRKDVADELINYLTNEPFDWNKKDFNSDGSLSKKGVDRLDKDLHDNWYKIWNESARTINPQLEEFNSKYDFSKTGDRFETEYGQQYIKDYLKLADQEYVKAINNRYGLDKVKNGQEYVDMLVEAMNHISGTRDEFLIK